MDEQSLMRLAAFADNKTKELEDKLSLLNAVAEKINVASVAIHSAVESLNGHREEIKSLRNSSKQDLKNLTHAIQNRPIVGGWQIGGVISFICLLLTFGIVAYDRYNQEIILDKKLSMEREDLEKSIKLDASNDVKWANSPEGKAAKELFTTTRDKYGIDYSTLDKKSKEILYMWINEMRKSAKK